MQLSTSDWLIALDPSLTSPGFCRQPVDGSLAEVWSIKPRGTHMERICAVEDELAKAARGAVFAFIEGYAFGSQYQRETAGEVVGVLKRRLFKMGIPYRVIPPAQHRKFTTGFGEAPELRGKAAKEWFRQTMERLSGLRFATSDMADAWSVAQMGAAVLKTLADPAFLLTLPRHQQEVLLRHCAEEILDAPCLQSDPAVAAMVARLRRERDLRRARRTRRSAAKADPLSQQPEAVCGVR